MKLTENGKSSQNKMANIERAWFIIEINYEREKSHCVQLQPGPNMVHLDGPKDFSKFTHEESIPSNISLLLPFLVFF